MEDEESSEITPEDFGLHNGQEVIVLKRTKKATGMMAGLKSMTILTSLTNIYQAKPTVLVRLI
jgi:hypothetical protein